MGMLVNGQWQMSDARQHGRGAQRENQTGQFRHWIEAKPQSQFPAAVGRYLLVVSTACPNCHRVLLMWRIKGLQAMVSVAVVNPVRSDQGWHFGEGHGVVADPVMQAEYLHQWYQLAQADYTGRASVPILWDRHHQTIVSNESGDIMRMFNSAFDSLGAKAGDYYPSAQQEAIDEWNDRLFHHIHDGVYRAGLTDQQAVYRRAVMDVFGALDTIEQQLNEHDYLLGDEVTEADWRLWVILVRFDAIYYSLFQCNVRRMIDYLNIHRYIKRLYCLPGVAETFDLNACKQHYYLSYPQCNPLGVVPLGPALDFTAAYDKAAQD